MTAIVMNAPAPSAKYVLLSYKRFSVAANPRPAAAPKIIPSSISDMNLLALNTPSPFASSSTRGATMQARMRLPRLGS